MISFLIAPVIHNEHCVSSPWHLFRHNDMSSPQNSRKTDDYVRSTSFSGSQFRFQIPMDVSLSRFTLKLFDALSDSLLYCSFCFSFSAVHMNPQLFPTPVIENLSVIHLDSEDRSRRHDRKDQNCAVPFYSLRRFVKLSSHFR
jgi:hypothetical protein